MNVFEAICKRKSIRAYESTLIPDEKINKILEAARLAPSAGNIQPWHFIVVKNKEKREKLSQGTFAKFLANAPIVIVGCGNMKSSPKWHVVDVSIAMEHMVLEATELGLGTCWVGSFNEEEVKELLKIPEEYKVIALLAIGYPHEKIDILREILHIIRRRKKLEEIVSFEEFGRKKK